MGTSLPLSILLNPSSDTATSQQSEQTPALSCQSLVHYPLDSPFRIIGQDHQPTQERQARPTRPQEARRWTYFIRGSPTPSIIPVLPRWIFHSRLFFLFHHTSVQAILWSHGASARSKPRIFFCS